MTRRRIDIARCNPPPEGQFSTRGTHVPADVRVALAHFRLSPSALAASTRHPQGTRSSALPRS